MFNDVHIALMLHLYFLYGRCSDVMCVVVKPETLTAAGGMPKYGQIWPMKSPWTGTLCVWFWLRSTWAQKSTSWLRSSQSSQGRVMESLWLGWCSWSPVMMFQLKQPVSEDEKLNGKYIRRAPGLWEWQHKTLVPKAYYTKFGHVHIDYILCGNFDDAFWGSQWIDFSSLRSCKKTNYPALKRTNDCVPRKWPGLKELLLLL